MMTRWTAFTLILLIPPCSNAWAGGAGSDDDPEDFFERKVRPILAGTCVKCHGPVKASGGLRVDSREAILKGGETGPAVVPGDAEEEPLDPGSPARRRITGDAAGQVAAGFGAGRPRRLGRRRRKVAEAGPVDSVDLRTETLGLRATGRRRSTRRSDRMGRATARSVHRIWPSSLRTATRSPSQPPGADPPRLPST